MMKRVSLYQIKTSLVGRHGSRRGERPNANGDSLPNEEECEREQLDAESKQINASRNCLKDRTTVDSSKSSKSNILRTLRLKWRRRKRSKREGRGRSDSYSQISHTEVSEQGFVSKQSRSKPLKCNTRGVVCPMPSPVQCVRRDSSGNFDSEESSGHLLCSDSKMTTTTQDPNSSGVSTEELRGCTCFGSPSKRYSRKPPDTSTGACENRSLQKSVVNSSLQAGHTLPTVMFTSSLESKCEQNALTAVATDCSGESVDENETEYSSKRCLDEFPAFVSPPVDENSCVSVISNSFSDAPRVGSLTQELYKLSKCGWYWGPITRSEAEEKLTEQPDGAFLVRDSSDDRYLLSLSFRSYGKTLHTRIEHCNGLFSFYSQHEPEGHTSIVELIEQSMNYSQSGVFCYSRSRSPGSPSFPVRLTRPVSRFTQVRSLQYLCRFVIRQYTRFDHIQKLPLPARIRGYLEEGHY